MIGRSTGRIADDAQREKRHSENVACLRKGAALHIHGNGIRNDGQHRISPFRSLYEFVTACHCADFWRTAGLSFQRAGSRRKEPWFGFKPQGHALNLAPLVRFSAPHVVVCDGRSSNDIARRDVWNESAGDTARNGYIRKIVLQRHRRTYSGIHFANPGFDNPDLAVADATGQSVCIGVWTPEQACKKSALRRHCCKEQNFHGLETVFEKGEETRPLCQNDGSMSSNGSELPQKPLILPRTPGKCMIAATHIKKKQHIQGVRKRQAPIST